MDLFSIHSWVVARAILGQSLSSGWSTCFSSRNWGPLLIETICWVPVLMLRAIFVLSSARFHTVDSSLRRTFWGFHTSSTSIRSPFKRFRTDISATLGFFRICYSDQTLDSTIWELLHSRFTGFDSREMEEPERVQTGATAPGQASQSRTSKFLNTLSFSRFRGRSSVGGAAVATTLGSGNPQAVAPPGFSGS
jgi:hypothetical protein